MPINNQMLIDLALNVAGYLAAGALSLVMYSTFRRSPRSAAPRETAAPRPAPSAGPTVSMPAGANLTPDARGMQFVGFGESSRGETGPQGTSLRRNRVEVLRLARGMLRSGATDAEIKAALPVSDAELAVLTYERQ